MQHGGRVTHVLLDVPTIGSHVMRSGVSMSASLPDPHELGIMATAAVLGNSYFDRRTKPGTELTATRFGLVPRCCVKAAAHAFI